MDKSVEELGRAGLIERAGKDLVDSVMRNFTSLANGVRNKKYERVPGIGDDFIPDVNGYNLLGAMYPALNREQKDFALRAVLAQFSDVNYLYVNVNHTPFIREPTLLADIKIVRPLYWPGLRDQANLLNGKESFAEIEREIMDDKGLFNPEKVKSDFLVAYSLLRSDSTNFGEDYVKAANPTFLDRTLRGIVATRFANASDDKQVGAGMSRLKVLLPASTHDKLEQYRQEGGWADASKF